MPGEKDIFQAAKTNDVARIRYLIEEEGLNPNIKYTRDAGDTFVHTLANAGFYVTQTALWGTTGTLALAAVAAAPETAGMSLLLLPLAALIGLGSSEANKAMLPSTYNINNWSPLYFAAYGGASEAAALLVHYGADPEYVDWSGTLMARSYSDIASSLGHVEFAGSMANAQEKYKKELRAEITKLAQKTSENAKKLEQLGIQLSDAQKERTGLETKIATLQTSLVEAHRANRDLLEQITHLQQLDNLKARREIVELKRKLVISEKKCRELETENAELKRQSTSSTARMFDRPDKSRSAPVGPRTSIPGLK